MRTPALNDWVWAGEPMWLPESQYSIGDKPTAPPRKMCTLAGVEFPMPEASMPAPGTLYFFPSFCAGGGVRSLNISRFPGGCTADRKVFGDNLMHLMSTAAEAHYRALVAATKQAMESAR